MMDLEKVEDNKLKDGGKNYVKFVGKIQHFILVAVFSALFIRQSVLCIVR